jgi:hypothetical protein
MDLAEYPLTLNKRIPVRVLMVFISWIGVLSILFISQLGIGISPDSIGYIGGARSLLAGYGFSFPASDSTYAPITHFAPFYSLLLSFGGIFWADPMLAARWLNGILFGLNIILVGIVVLSLQKRSYWKVLYLPLLASGLVFFSPSMLEIHLMAWTEPIFIFLGLAGFYLLSKYFETSRLVFLISSAMVISLAALSRYIGISIIASGFFGILLFYPEGLKKRFLDAILFGSLSTGPVVIWMLRNIAVAGTATSREFAAHPISKMHLEWALTTLSSWLLVPASADALIKIMPLLLIASGFVAVAFLNIGRVGRVLPEKSTTEIMGIPTIIKLLFIFGIVYSLFLVFSISFLDANTPLDSRILSPVFIAGLIITVYTIGELGAWISHRRYTRLFFNAVLVIFGGIFLVSYLSAWIGLSREVYTNGMGFNDLAWKNSKTLEEVRQLSGGISIYTNSPEAIYIGTGRVAKSLPKKFESMTQTENTGFVFELSEMHQELKEEGGVLVYFDRIQRPTLPSKSELMEILDLHLVSSTGDGDLFTVNGIK